MVQLKDLCQKAPSNMCTVKIRSKWYMTMANIPYMEASGVDGICKWIIL